MEEDENAVNDSLLFELHVGVKKLNIPWRIQKIQVYNDARFVWRMKCGRYTRCRCSIENIIFVIDIYSYNTCTHEILHPYIAYFMRYHHITNITPMPET